jgi:hypothetical protein
MQSDLRHRDFDIDDIKILEDEKADFAVFSNNRFMESVFPITAMLIERHNWVPVYSDENGYVLVKPSKENAALIERFRISKETLYSSILGALENKIRESPSDDTHITARTAVLDHLLYLGRDGAAIAEPGR